MITTSAISFSTQVILNEILSIVSEDFTHSLKWFAHSEMNFRKVKVIDELNRMY